jgi:hypothetical protein
MDALVSRPLNWPRSACWEFLLDLSDRLLDLALARLTEAGLVGERGTQRTDSTHVLAAVRDLTRLELITEAVRAALEQIAGTAPQLLVGLVDDEWGRRYGLGHDSEWACGRGRDARPERASRAGIVNRSPNEAIMIAQRRIPNAPTRSPDQGSADRCGSHALGGTALPRTRSTAPGSVETLIAGRRESESDSRLGWSPAVRWI